MDTKACILGGAIGLGSNRFGTVSKLHISIDKTNTSNGDKDILSHISFTAPFKVMSPFYDEYGNMSVMVMSASAGIMEGDQQDIFIEVGKNASGKIFSQSFEKIHKMIDGSATRNTRVCIKQGAFFEYSPLPTIPFEGSNFIANTEIRLEDKTSRLIFSDILSAGRVAMCELFKYSYYYSKLSIYCGDELVYFDNTNYNPKMLDISGFCLQEGYSHQSSLLLFNFDISADCLEQIDRYIETIISEQDTVGGYSFTSSSDIVFRFLARSAQILQNICSSVVEIISHNKIV